MFSSGGVIALLMVGRRRDAGVRLPAGGVQSRSQQCRQYLPREVTEAFVVRLGWFKSTRFGQDTGVQFNRSSSRERSTERGVERGRGRWSTGSRTIRLSQRARCRRRGLSGIRRGPPIGGEFGPVGGDPFADGVDDTPGGWLVHSGLAHKMSVRG